MIAHPGAQVIASDGVFDVFDNQQVVQPVSQVLHTP